MIFAFHYRNPSAIETSAKQFIDMLDDQNRLFAADSRFLIGRWLSDARSAAAGDPSQRDLNERNARLLVTTWTRERSGLGDYSWREWNGLLDRYCRPRWLAFITDLRGRLAGRKPSPPNYFGMESAWVARCWETDSYAVTVSGDPVNLSRELLDRWGSMLDDAGRYTAPDKPLKPATVEDADQAR